MDPLEKEIRLLADARDRLYHLGAPSPICDDLDKLIDHYHQVAEQFRATLLAALDAAKSSDTPMGKAYHRLATLTDEQREERHLSAQRDSGRL